MVKAKLKTKVLLKDSLRSMPVGSFLKINIREAKTSAVRVAASRLKEEGFLFDVTDKGRIDDVIVTRLK
ncbi:MAG: hypothetical protein IJ338_02305 [Bacteroidaceae bacterium]|nr:hypothetical protein [Bacteroidaceae bacterium]